MPSLLAKVESTAGHIRNLSIEAYRCHKRKAKKTSRSWFETAPALKKCKQKFRIEKFAAKARAYICTYHHLEHQRQQGPGAFPKTVKNRSSKNFSIQRLRG
jgi:hypothetical protein